MRLRRSALLGLAVGTLALGGTIVPAMALGTSAPPPPATTHGWRTVTAVSAGLFANLADIAVTGPDDAWAVGQAFTTGPVPLVERWNGVSWRRVALPRVLLNRSVPSLMQTAVSQRGQFWAFGIGGQWLHWNGTWTLGTMGFSILDASAMFGPKDVWAFGGSATNRPVAFRYTGSGGWKRVAVPGRNAISAVSAISRNDIWAVLGTAKSTGQSSPSGGLVRWNGDRWSTVTSLPAKLANASLGAVLARSDRNVWVGGAVRNGKGGTTEAIGHWNGNRWTVITLAARASSARYHVSSLVTDGAGGLWAVGECQSCVLRPTRLWHESAGRWSGPKLPRLSRHRWTILGLTATGHSVWAAGFINNASSSTRGLIALWGPRP